MKPTPLMPGIALPISGWLNPVGPISAVRPAILPRPIRRRFTWPATPIAGVDTGAVPAVSSMPTIRHSATSAAAGSHSTLSEPAM